MADSDASNWLDKFAGSKPRTFNLIHQSVLSVLFFLSKVGVIVIDPAYSVYFDTWVAANLVAMAAMLIKRPLTKPRVADRKCLSCGSIMAPTSWVCKSCGGTFNEGK